MICIRVFDKWSGLACKSVKTMHKTQTGLHILRSILLLLRTWIRRRPPPSCGYEDLTHNRKAKGRDRRRGGKEGQRGGWRRAVRRLHGGRRGRAGQSCSALHTPESTGSWIRLSWACKSSRLDTSYSGSDRCSRTGEGGAHRKRGTEVRGGTTTVDKSRRRQLKEI